MTTGASINMRSIPSGKCVQLSNPVILNLLQPKPNNTMLSSPSEKGSAAV